MSFPYEKAALHENMPMILLMNSVKYVTMHWHDRIEFILVLHGEITVHVGSNTYYLREKDLIFINSNEVHGVEASTFNKVLLLQIPNSFVKKYHPLFEDKSFKCHSFSEENQSKYDILRRLLINLFEIFNDKEQYYEIKIHSVLLDIIYHLLSNFKIKENELNKINNSNDRKRLTRIVNYIEQNYMHSISLEEIANSENISTSYLSRYFHKHMGQSLIKYINSIRLEHAVRMLLETNHNLIEIAIECGFNNISLFHKIFKEKFKVTPTTFRKTERMSQNNIRIEKEYGIQTFSDKPLSNEINPYKYMSYEIKDI